MIEGCVGINAVLCVMDGTMHCAGQSMGKE